jgi:hypothetical protein
MFESKKVDPWEGMWNERLQQIGKERYEEKWEEKWMRIWEGKKEK